MVIVLLLVLFFALVSVGLWAYSRVLLTSAAADAARYVADADVPSSSAADRARRVMGDGIARRTAGTIDCRSDTQGLLVGVTCTMTTPGLFPFLDGVLGEITVTGHSLKEQP